MNNLFYYLCQFPQAYPIILKIGWPELLYVNSINMISDHPTKKPKSQTIKSQIHFKFKIKINNLYCDSIMQPIKLEFMQNESDNLCNWKKMNVRKTINDFD
jgi:hypothetical protein